VNDVTLFKSCVTLTGNKRFTFEKYLKIIIMPLLTILIVIIVAGVLLWLVNTYIPMDGKIKTIFNVVVVIIVIVWLLKVFGLFAYLKDIHI
jgi:hypothetical protein